MSVDKYSVCPCGSGKKIKFCKCKDSVGLMDRVLKMVEGGQIVPALDQLASILQEHPDAAWALAIRGQLLLDLREYDSLSGNADRFIRLQPGNPLALTQRAAAKLFHGEVEEATAAMLQALTESGMSVDSFVLDIAAALAYSLAQRGVYLTARIYASLAMMASQYAGGQAAHNVLRQLNGAPTISQLLKAIPPRIERPAAAEWGERYDEAATLLQNNKIVLAESKFESLRRTLPKEPAILWGLLTCAIWRGDVAAQAEMLKKLSECSSLDMEQRIRFRAMSVLVDPDMPEISTPLWRLHAEIGNVEEVEMALTADARFVSMPAELLAGFRDSEDDIPPRSGFQILDRDKPESLDKLPSVDEVPEAIALVLVYGRQTDREARIEVLEVRTKQLEEVRGRIGAALPSLRLVQEAGEPLNLLVAAQPTVAILRYHARPIEAERLQGELVTRRLPRSFVSIELPLLAGGSLQSMADDASKLFERTVVVRIIEQYDAVASRGEAILAELYRLAKLEPLPTIRPTRDQIESIENADLNRVDIAALEPEPLLFLLHRAQQVSSTPLLRRAAQRMIEIDLSEQQKPARMLAYMTLINTAERPDEALRLLDQAKAFAEAHKYSISNLLLSEVGLRLQAGDSAGFQKAIQTLSTRYGHEPEVLARLQQLLMSYGLIGPDGSPRSVPAAAAAAPAPGGLWTPGSPEPAVPASESGSKLWIPGMD